jgi:hypothetical protein
MARLSRSIVANFRFRVSLVESSVFLASLYVYSGRFVHSFNPLSQNTKLPTSFQQWLNGLIRRKARNNKMIINTYDSYNQD